MKPKIAFFELEDWEKKYIKKSLKGYQLIFFDELNKNSIKKIKDCEILCIFIYSDITKQVLDDLPKLKLITTRSTGFDHINLDECKKKNITVCNVPYYGANTVAEHTFALILNLTRRIHKAYEKTVRGDFSLDGLRGFDLRGKSIGIVGCGNIGIHVARIAKGFEMNVFVFDLKKDEKLAKKLGFEYANLNTLLKKSDIVTLHVPYNKFTHHLINKNNINLFKKGAIIINTSRGGLVETDALVRALRKGTIGGAGLDVLEEEGLIREESQLLSKKYTNKMLATLLENHILLKMDNVIVTPHNAFNSKEALIRILDTTIEDIKSFWKGKTKNIVK
jgi:D-lactate dehydrogenase